MKTQNRITRLLAFAVIFLMSGCERDYNNPWDGKASLDPNSWAPQNLAIEDVSITEKKFTWTYTGDNRFEGFKLDRKAGNAEWQEAYQVLPKEARNWTDSQIIPDPSLTYSYRVYAFAGKYKSAEKTSSIAVEFPAPANVQIEKLTDKSYKIKWSDNSTGEQGFKIDRKIDEGNWVVAFGNVPANQTSFTDTNVFRAVNVEYRVYAFLEGHESSKVEVATNAEVAAPTNLQITPNSINSVTINWQDNSNGEDGFKIERKVGGGNWEPLTTLPANITTIEDNAIELNTTVYYRVNAFVRQYFSSYAEKSFNSSIPAPSNLQITPNSLTSVTLSWQDNSNGEAGFIIDRKVNSGLWELAYGVLVANQVTFNDNIVSWQTNDYTYRVHSFFGQYNSVTVDSTISWPEITTSPITNIEYNSATSGGNITIQGNYTIIARGVCYGTNQNPDMSGTHTSDGSGAGTFSSNISGLNFGTNYNVRAYATTNFGILYGMHKNFVTNSPGIGDTYDGGIVFYLDGNGGGLVCAPTDQSTGVQWGCYGTTIWGTLTAVGTGASNTAIIVAGCSTSGIAAQICNDLILSGYNDWFLPSKDELSLMYQNLKVFGIGGFASNYYWSSSGYNQYNAWVQYFPDGYKTYHEKNLTAYVRAVRAF